MKTASGHRLACAVVALLFTTGLVLPQAGLSPITPAAPSEQGGIKVHGHWTIEVRNPDGSLAERREFDNSLLQGPLSGNDFLARILGRGNSVGEWEVDLLGNACLVGTTPTLCTILEPMSQVQPNTAIFNNLTKSIPSSGPNAGKVVLDGSAFAATAGQITDVRTAPVGCSSATAPATPCLLNASGSISFVFTQHSLGANPVNLVAGQAIQVTVVISFS